MGWERGALPAETGNNISLTCDTVCGQDTKKFNETVKERKRRVKSV